jgi:hypothetical protein
MSQCSLKNNHVLASNLRHLLDEKVPVAGVHADYSSRIVYHNSGTNGISVQITDEGGAGNHSNVCQYERNIEPSINIDCGFTYIPKKKGVMKFYSYTVLIYTGRAAAENIEQENIQLSNIDDIDDIDDIDILP